jgi:hypothetical protein
LQRRKKEISRTSSTKAFCSGKPEKSEAFAGKKRSYKEYRFAFVGIAQKETRLFVDNHKNLFKL